MEDLSGKQFGHYQVVAPLGEGGMAAVYKAYQPSTERYVAVKVLPRHMSASEEFVIRFKREATLLAQLQHPHILPVFDYGEADGYPYIVMPFVNSGTLAEFLQKQPPTLSEVRRIMIQLCDALGYAHMRGMIHRDIKPSNVLIDERGNCLLTDFGLARMAETSTKITSSGAVMGTPAYMSPEQGTGYEVDQRSDLYSLGIIFYEMVTGRVPYTAETPIAVVFKHIQDPLPSARKFNPDLAEEIERVLLKALAKTPEDRYQTGEEFAQAVQWAIPETISSENLSWAGQKAPAGPTHRQEKPGNGTEARTARRDDRDKPAVPVKRYGIALATAVVLVAVFAWLAFFKPEGAPASNSRTQTANDQPSLSNDSDFPGGDPGEGPGANPVTDLDYSAVSAPLAIEGTALPLSSQEINAQNADQVVQIARWGEGIISQAVYSSDGTRIALATSTGIHLFDAKDLAKLRTIETAYFIKSIAFSDNDRTIVAVSSHGDILKFKTDDGSFIGGIQGGYKDLRNVRVSPDASMIALDGFRSENYTRALELISVDDGGLVTELTMDNFYSSLSSLSFSPDNRWIAAIGSDGKIYLWDARGGGFIRAMTDSVSGIYHIAFSPDSTTLGSLSNDGAITLWNVADGKHVQTYEGHGTYIPALAFSSDGTRIIYRAGEEGMIRIRNIGDGVLANSFQNEVGAGWGGSITVSPDGRSFLLIVQNRSISLWDIDRGVVVASWSGFSDYLSTVAISADGKFLVSDSEYGDVWQIEQGRKVQTILATPGYNGSPIVSKTNQLLYNSNEGASIWSWTNGRLVKVRELAYIYFSEGMSLSPDGAILATSNGTDIELWDTSNSSKINNLSGHTDNISDTAFSPDGSRLASASYDNTIVIWDLAAGSAEYTLKDHLGQVYTLAFSPDGKVLASSGYDGLIIFWDVKDGKAVTSIELPPRVYAQSLSFSPNGEILAAGSDDGAIYFWETSTGKLLHTVTGHTNTAASLAFTPDGKLLASGSYDGTIRLWGVEP